MLTLVFGASVFATSAVLSAFMGGLAFGSYLFGNVADRSRNPLRVYALLEILIGIYALAFPFMVTWFDVMYVALFRTTDPPFYLLSLLRFFLAVAVLIVPTTLMGGTLPILSKYVTVGIEKVSWSTGSLYAVNTLGAVLGCAAAGFLLIGAVGLLKTTHLAVVANLLVGAVTFLLSSKPMVEWEASRAEEAQPAARPAGETDAPVEGPVYSESLTRLVIIVFGVSGFCALAYEVLWTRVLVFHLNISTYAFTTMLVTFLVGIGVGSLIFAGIADRSRDPLLLFCAIEILIGVSAVLSLPIFGKFFYTLEALFPAFGIVSWLPTTNKFIKSFLTMLFPTLLMGAAFPVVVKICSESLEKLGRSVGRVYSVNTLGAVLGSFMAVFVLIPLLGIGKSILLLGCVNVAMGVAIFYAHPRISQGKKRRACLAAAPLLLLFGFFVLRFADIKFASKLENQSEVLYYKEGLGATVKVFRNKDSGILEISIDGYPVAATGKRSDMRGPEIQKALAYFPMLLHKGPKDVCIIGFGAGGTSYLVSLFDVENIVCVELCPEVPKAAPLLSEVNHGVLHNPKFRLVIEDGRNYILRTERRFDVVTVDATSPKHAGNVSLYTKQFFDMCKEKLLPEGIMALWVPYHLLSRQEDLLLFNTFRQSFPHFSVWFTSGRGYFLLIGSDGPQPINFRHLAERMSKPSIRRELAEVAVLSPYDFLACFAIAEDVEDSFFEGVSVNTDDHPLIEYFRRDAGGLGEFILDRRLGEPLVYDFGETPEEAIDNARRYRSFMKSTNHMISATYWNQRGNVAETMRQIRLAIEADPTNLEAVSLKPRIEQRYKRIYLTEAEQARERNDFEAARLACERILQILPDDKDTLNLLRSLYEMIGESDRSLKLGE